jgi:tRNA A-37 threonylcarbamoyl transferase component Bud32
MGDGHYNRRPMSVPFSGTSRFRVVRVLGAGGFGTVYEVEDLEGRVRLALKTLARLDAASLYRFKNEFRVFADVHHPNLVRVHELFSEGDFWFFTMDLVEGVDWLTYVVGPTAFASARDDETKDLVVDEVVQAAIEAKRRPVDLARLRSTLSQIVEGLSALHHARVIHRDIKPANVLVTSDGRVVILDFGLATTAVSESASMADVHAIMGTPSYMAPEQAVGTASSPATDWYAVGCMMFQALTDSLPFTGSSLKVLLEKQGREAPRPSTRAPDVPPDLDDLCVELLRTEPSQRPTLAQIVRRLGTEVATPAARPPSSSAAAPFVGRADVLADLVAAYEIARAGTLAVAFVHGASGMGKSAAVKTFIERAKGKPVVLQGRCFQRESVPYKAFDHVIDALTRYLLTLPREDVAALMPREVAALARIFPVLERVPAIAEAPRKAAELRDPQLIRRRAFAALRELLARLSDRHPVILVLDDVQWGDADSAGLLGELTSPPEAPPLLVILAYRSEEASNSPLLSAFLRRAEVVGLGGDRREIEIHPLRRPEALELAERLLVGTPGARHLAPALAEESLGSPFFLGELAQYAQTNLGDFGRKSVRLEDLILLRVSQLTEQARHVLRIVCICGGNVRRGVATRASELAEGIFTQTLGSLRIGNMIKLAGIKGELLEPFHDRIRETVLLEVSEALRTRLHRALALALIEEASPDPELLLLHYRAAGMWDQARIQARKAAEKAVSALAFDRAASLWGEALSIEGWDPHDQREIEQARAEALVNAGRGALAANAFLALVHGADATTKIDLMQRAGEQLLYVGDTARGMSVIREVMSSVGESLPSSAGLALFRILLLRAWLAIRGWSFKRRDPRDIRRMDMIRIAVMRALARASLFVDPAYGAYYALRLAAVALPAGEPQGILFALTGCANLFMAAEGGPTPTWRALSAKSTELADSLNDPRAHAFCELARGMAMTMVGSYVESEPLLARTLSYYRELGIGTQWDYNSAMFMWSTNRARAGDYATLCARLPVYHRDGFDRGDLWLLTNLRVGEPSIQWLVVDEPTQGRRDVEDALRAWHHDGLDTQRWQAICSLALIDLYLGSAGSALASLESLIRQLRWSTLRFLPLVQSAVSMMAFSAAISHLAEAPTDTGRLKTARRRQKHARRSVTSFHAPILALLEAGYSYARGERGRAAELTAQALRATETGGLAQYAAFARFRLGQLEGGAEGEHKMAVASQWMSAQGIKRPDRFMNTHSPGFAGVTASA